MGAGSDETHRWPRQRSEAGTIGSIPEDDEWQGRRVRGGDGPVDSLVANQPPSGEEVFARAFRRNEPLDVDRRVDDASFTTVQPENAFCYEARVRDEVIYPCGGFAVLRLQAPYKGGGEAMR